MSRADDTGGTAERQVLLNPGPVTLTPAVRAALGAGDWCHREPEFAALTRHLNERLVAIHGPLDGFRAVTLAGSGTAAVEAMLASFAPASSATLVVANGVYGERMGAMLRAQGRPHRVLTHAWTAAPDPGAITAALDDVANGGDGPPLTHLAVVHHETTTGRLNDLDAIGRLCRERGLTLLLDAVSSFGAERIEGEAWNLGALAATANKCLHGAPGLSFVLARRDLFEASGEGCGSVYLDLRRYYEAQHRDGFSPFTLPVQVAFALDAALAEHAAGGGWEARRQVYLERAARIGRALAGAGVQPLIPPEESSAVLRAWCLPEGRGYAELHDALRDDGFVIYAGQGDLARSIFRIAHMGDIRPDELDRLCRRLPALLARGPA